MTAPPRLLDESTDPLIVEILSAAREQAPRNKSVQATLLAVGTAASVVAGQTSAGAAATGSVALGSLTKLAAHWTIFGSLVVGGGVGLAEFGPRVFEGPSESQPVQPMVATTAAQGSAGRRGARSLAEATPAPPDPQQQAYDAVVPDGPEPDNAVLPRAAPTPSVSKVSSTSGAANRSQASEQEQLAREVAILDAARLALGRSDYDAAARLSASYLTQYPSGRLEPEARYMKMQAEVHGGRLDRARHEARRLLELDPEGPHAEAARGVNLLH